MFKYIIRFLLILSPVFMPNLAARAALDPAAYTARLIAPKGSTGNSFSSQDVSITLNAGAWLKLSFKNLSKQAISIDWNQARFLNPDANPADQKIFIKGWPLSENNKALPTTVIAPKASFTTELVPQDHVGQSAQGIEPYLPPYYLQAQRYPGFGPHTLKLALKIRGKQQFQQLVYELKLTQGTSPIPATQLARAKSRLLALNPGLSDILYRQKLSSPQPSLDERGDAQFAGLKAVNQHLDTLKITPKTTVRDYWRQDAEVMTQWVILLQSAQTDVRPLGNKSELTITVPDFSSHLAKILTSQLLSSGN